MTAEKQVKTKKRVADHGEVYTNAREVNAMLDLVKQETERIDSRFLEPACGSGNFLAEVLRRKLEVVAETYSKNQLDYERNSFLAVSSLYGIDILLDNVLECRQRLADITLVEYRLYVGKKAKPEFAQAIWFLLDRNIEHGDALELKKADGSGQPIVFSEWSFVKGSQVKRRDFTFKELLEQQSMSDLPLFNEKKEVIFIPTPVRVFPPTHFLGVQHTDDQSL